MLGGDVWDLLDELMIYMRNPMRYYEKQVKFVRVIYKLNLELELEYYWNFKCINKYFGYKLQYNRECFYQGLQGLEKHYLQGH